jgi:hypothetical protein
MKEIYSTFIIPENQNELILSLFVDGIVYHIWKHECFVVIKEYKHKPSKATLNNMHKEELKMLLSDELQFTGNLNDERVLFYNIDLWNKLGF